MASPIGIADMSYAIIASDRFAKRAMLDAMRDAYGIRTPTHAARRGWSQPSDWEPGTQYVEPRNAEHWHLCDEDGELIFCSRDNAR